MNDVEVELFICLVEERREEQFRRDSAGMGMASLDSLFHEEGRKKEGVDRRDGVKRDLPWMAEQLFLAVFEENLDDS